MNSNIITIKREKAVDLNEIDGMLGFGFQIDSEDTSSIKITSLDISKLHLEVLLDGKDIPPQEVHEKINRKLQHIRTQGGVLLDAKVLSILLKNTALIPHSWSELADCDNGLSIRFDGTVLKVKSSGEAAVLQPFTERGHWNWGWGSRFPDCKNVSVFQYTAVLTP